MKIMIICEGCGAEVPLNVVGNRLPDGVEAECPKCGCYHFVCIDFDKSSARNVPSHIKNKLETK